MTDKQIERMKELAYKAYPDVKDKSEEYWYNNSPSRTVFMDGACAAYAEMEREQNLDSSCNISKDLQPDIDEMTKAYIDKMPDLVLNSIGVTNWMSFFNSYAKEVARTAYHQGLTDMYNKLKV